MPSDLQTLRSHPQTQSFAGVDGGEAKGRLLQQPSGVIGSLGNVVELGAASKSPEYLTLLEPGVPIKQS